MDLMTKLQYIGFGLEGEMKQPFLASIPMLGGWFHSAAYVWSFVSMGRTKPK